jgi:hypothetical protein
MNTRRWIGRVALVAGIALTLGLWRADAGIAISGGTQAQQAMGRWAEDRFRDAGIGIPSLDLQFHSERTGCNGRLGLFADGTAHFCGIHVNDLSRRTLMHELAHAWIDSHVSVSLEVRFLRLRGLEAWNDHEVEWEQRGTEHAAEIMAWALDGKGTGTELPSIPDNEPHRLARAYQLLTGRQLPD